MSQGAGIQMQPMPPYGASRAPHKMASQESVTSEGSLYLEPTQIPSRPGSGEAGVPYEHDSGVVDVDGLHPEFLSDSSLPRHNSRSSLPTSTAASPQKGSASVSPYLKHGQSPLQEKVPDYPKKMAKRPDSLAGKGHEYEELPHSRYTNPSRPYYNESESGSSGEVGRPPPPSLAKLVSLNNNSGSRGSMENLCDPPGGGDRPATTHRRRQNPLYNSIEHEEVDYKSKRRKSDWCQCLCLMQIVIAIIALLALLLAVLSLTGATEDDEPKTAMVVGPPNQGELDRALERIKQLEENYTQLLQKHESLQVYVYDVLSSQNISELTEQVRQIEAVANTSTVHEALIVDLSGKVEGLENNSETQQESLLQINAQLKQQDDQFGILESTVAAQNRTLQAVRDQTGVHDSQLTNLQSTHSQDIGVIQQDLNTYNQKFVDVTGDVQRVEASLTADMSRLNSSLRLKVNEVSKMEGPQGPPGVGNLTACQVHSHSYSTSISMESTPTSWLPETQPEAESSVFLGVECTTKGGAVSLLETQEKSGWAAGANSQYRCICTGRSASAGTTRKCVMVYWLCPRLS